MENDEKNADLLKTAGQLIGLIAHAISGKVYTVPADADFQKIFHLAELHRVGALAAAGLHDFEVSPEVLSVFDRELFRTAARYTALLHETKALSAAFSAEKIGHCFLKGTRISAYYDQPELRFMLDLDILADPERFDAASKVLLHLGYERTDDDIKDMSFKKAPFYIVELHRRLKYDYDPGSGYFTDAFESLIPDDGGEYCLKMTDEDFFVYVLSHTAHHLTAAGTGLRSVVDDYYLRKKLLPKCDPALLQKKLEASGLLRLNGCMEKLGAYWFESGPADDLTQQLASYIIFSGVYGTEDNDLISGVLRRGSAGASRTGYFFRRIFPGRTVLEKNYPILTRHPVLLPVCWLARLFRSLFSFKRLRGEAEGVRSVTEAKKAERKDFFENLGL